MRTNHRRHQAAATPARRAVAGKVAGFFDEHASMVLGLCRLLLRDHHEAEDAAQQTFVSAYRSMLRGNEPRDAAPWLAAIARNECRARIRKRMRAPVALDGELESQLADPADLTEIADRRSELAEITVALADLPIRQREAVALRDFLGLSYEEVASTLAVSVPVVESLLFRARRTLRDTVRTVPRYAAGLVVVPLAIRAAIAREVPDFDSVGPAAGIAGGAAVILGAGLAKLVSLPFAAKAVTAVAVVAAGVVAPLLEGPSPAPAPVAAAPAIVDPSSGPAAPRQAVPESEPASEPASGQAPAAPEQAKQDPGTRIAAPTAASPGSGAPAASEPEPDRLEASASTASGATTFPLLPVEPAEDDTAGACEEQAAPAKGWSDELAPCPETSDEGGAAIAPEPQPAESGAAETGGPPDTNAGEPAEPAEDGSSGPDDNAGEDASTDSGAGEDGSPEAVDPEGDPPVEP